MNDLSPKIRMMVVDDQDLIRRGLARMLEMEPDISVVGQASDGEQAVELAKRDKPDVLLMDIKMPRMTGIQATRIITKIVPHTQVIILTTYDTDDLVFDAIRAGAHAYLLKESSETEVLDVIRAVHRGESRIDPAIARKVLDEFRRVSAPFSKAANQKESELPFEELTERESEILNLLANGKDNLEISQTLCLTEGTVKNYVSRIMSKLHANDRTQRFDSQLRAGLASLEE